jgi:inorganic triphosphatase YgiF
MALEYELKYTADEEALSSIARVLPPATQEIQMHTTYFDTPAGDFAARRYTLRLRKENEKTVVTLKTPAKEKGREEYEVEAASLEAAIPELCKLGAPAELPELAAKGLAPLCEAKFHRTTWDLFIGDAYIELALDKGVLIGGGKEEPFCEVEVELKEGDKEIVDAFGADLANACGLKKQPKSKYQRAKALAKA